MTTPTKYNISQAARIIGMSRATISRAIKQGKLSVTIDDENRKWIGADELHRVYGNKCDFLRLGQGADTTKTVRSETPPSNGDAVVKALQEQLFKRYAEENEQLKESLHKALDNQNSFQKLLEDRSSQQDQWQELLDSKLDEIEQRQDKEIRKLRRALYYERNKSLWKRVFGSRTKRAIGK